MHPIPFLNSLATIANAELKCEHHRLQDRQPKSDQPQPAKAPGLTPKPAARWSTNSTSCSGQPVSNSN